MPYGLKIGILAHDFLYDIGANDFLRNIIRSLAWAESVELVLIYPKGDHLFKTAPWFLRFAADIAIEERIATTFLDDAPNPIPMVSCSQDAMEVYRVVAEHGLHLVLPAIVAFPDFIPCVTYWPDCQAKYFPYHFTQHQCDSRDALIGSLLSTGCLMITNSRDSRGDLIKFYEAGEAQVVALPFSPIVNPDYLAGIDEEACPAKDVSDYFLVSNQFWVHKSLETILYAVALLKERSLDPHVIFTGKMDEPRRAGYVPELLAIVDALELGDHIDFKGYLPKAEQLDLMRRSVAVVQSTLFEGGPGGGSVFDACSLDVPAIVSDLPVNREIPAEYDVTYFKPRNFIQLARAMEQALGALRVAAPVATLTSRSDDVRRRLGGFLLAAARRGVSIAAERALATPHALVAGEALCGGHELQPRLSHSDFHEAEDAGLWSCALRSSLVVALRGPQGGAMMTLRLHFRTFSAAIPNRRVRIRQVGGGEEAYEIEGWRTFSFEVRTWVAAVSFVQVDVEISELFSTPQEPRPLGVLLTGLDYEEAENGSAQDFEL